MSLLNQKKSIILHPYKHFDDDYTFSIYSSALAGFVAWKIAEFRRYGSDND